MRWKEQNIENKENKEWRVLKRDARIFKKTRGQKAEASRIFAKRRISKLFWMLREPLEGDYKRRHGYGRYIVDSRDRARIRFMFRI